jgi:hypothetical protein
VSLGFLLAALPGWAQAPLPSQLLMEIDEDQVWEGKIVIREQGHAHDERDDSNGEKIDTYSFNHSIDSTVTIYACGTLPYLHVSYFTGNRSDTLTKHKNKRYYETVLVGEGQNRHGEKMLNARSMEKNLSSVFYDGPIPKSKQQHGGKDGGVIGIIPIPPNRCMLSAACDLFLSISGHERTENIFPGQKKPDLRQTQFSTIPFDKEPKGRISVDAAGAEVTQVQSHPIPYYGASVTVQGEWSEKEISGSQVLAEEKGEKPGEMTRTVVAEWSFKPQGDPCEEVYDLLYQDLAWAEAYNDPDLRGMAKDLAEYKNLVGHRAADIYKGYLPPGMMGASVSMSVDPETCAIEGLDKAEELVRKRCLPDVILEAVLDHELRHAEQCQQEPEAFRDTENLENRARFELDAHIVGIKRLMKYVEENCEPSGNLYNIQTARQRLERLEAANRP